MFKFFGSKYKLADAYPAPAHDTIIEPFAGAAAYAVLHGRNRRVVLIEKDEAVVALWHRLLAMTADEIRGLPDPQPGKRSDDPLVAFAAGRTTRDTPVGGFVVSPRMAQRFRPMVNRVAATIDRCRHFEVTCADYSEAPDIEATWFIDPPYQPPPTGRWDRTRGGRYRHPNRDIDYGALSAWVRERRGQVIACDQDGADWLPFSRKIAVRDNTHAIYREVWWTNEDPPEQLEMTDA
jgi:site-specific DNA-adenine methylase